MKIEKLKNQLNIGAGKTYIPGFINIDISRKAEICLDIGKAPLPFEDNTVDLIFSYHTLEHVSDYLYSLSEMYRVLKNGGHLLLGLPYVSLTEYHLVNPYHKHNFNEFSFDFFDDKKLRGSAAEENSIHFEKIFHRFHSIGFFNLIPPPLKAWFRCHLFNVVRKIDYGLIAIKNSGNTDTVLQNRRKIFIQQFDKCLQSRVAYDQSSPPHC